jgi:hypothetical protein
LVSYLKRFHPWRTAESATIESFLKLLSALDLELVLFPKEKSVDTPSSITNEEW